jgi:hypothetical protein
MKSNRQNETLNETRSGGARPRMVRRRFTQVLCLCALVAAAAGPAAAGRLYIQGAPGATCKPSNLLTSNPTFFEYRDHRLLNTGRGSWDVFLATCPLSGFVPDADVIEVRVTLKDAARASAWCGIRDWSGREYDWEWMDWRSGYATAAFAPPPWSGSGLLEATIQCVVNKGASVERVELLWDTQ